MCLERHKEVGFELCPEENGIQMNQRRKEDQEERNQRYAALGRKTLTSLQREIRRNNLKARHNCRNSLKQFQTMETHTFHRENPYNWPNSHFKNNVRVLFNFFMLMIVFTCCFFSLISRRVSLLFPSLQPFLFIPKA